MGLEQIAYVSTGIASGATPVRHFVDNELAVKALCGAKTFPIYPPDLGEFCPDCIRLADALVNTPPRHVANRGSRQP